jgi:hypothetical protein
MATLAALEDRVRRKLGLETGNHTITCEATDPLEGQFILINDVGIELTNAGDQSNKFSAVLSTTPNTMATNLEAAIGEGFASDSGIAVSRASNVVTVTGARHIRVSAGTAFTVDTIDTEDSPPYTSDIDEWIKEAQLDIITKCTNAVFLADGTGAANIVVYDEIDTSGGSANVYNLPASLVRIVEVQAKTAVASDVIKRCEEVPYDLLLDIRNGAHPFFKTYTSLPVNAIYFSIFSTDSANSGKPRIEFSQTLAAHATDALQLIYIKAPNEVRTTECSFPSSLESLIIDRASAQCLIQIGQTEEGLVLLQGYEAGLAALNARYSSHILSPVDSYERPK